MLKTSQVVRSYRSMLKVTPLDSASLTEDQHLKIKELEGEIDFDQAQEP